MLIIYPCFNIYLYRCNTDRNLQKATKTVPFILTCAESSIQVRDPERASGIELATFYDKFHPTNVSWFQSIMHWFSGEKTKGFQNIELMLQQEKTLTGIGEVSISNNNEVVLGPPTDGRQYILATSYANLDTEKDLTTRIRKLKWSSVVCFILGTMSVVGFLFTFTNFPEHISYSGYQRQDEKVFLANFSYFFLHFSSFLSSDTPRKTLITLVSICLVLGFAMLIIPLICIKLWFNYQEKRRSKLLHAFKLRVKAIEDNVTDDERRDSTSSEEISVEDERNTCVVCMSEPRDCVLVDCGHICVCTTCAQELIPHQCPICRKRILQVIPVYQAWKFMSVDVFKNIELIRYEQFIESVHYENLQN